LFARGHVLLEVRRRNRQDDYLRAFARAVGGDFERVEGTVDSCRAIWFITPYVDAEGKPRIEPGPLLRHWRAAGHVLLQRGEPGAPTGAVAAAAGNGRANRVRVQREFRFPHMTVFADRNKSRRRRRSSSPRPHAIASCSEVRMPTPTISACVARWCSTPRSMTSDGCSKGLTGVVSWQELNRIGAAIQTSVTASEALERYVMDLWDASQSPQKFGVQLEGVDMDRLILAGPARAA
jgi:hypothetical protein